MITSITVLCYVIQLLLIKENFAKSPFHVKFKFVILEGRWEKVGKEFETVYQRVT